MHKSKKNTRIDPSTGLRRPLTDEERSVRSRIRKGVFPKFHFKRQEYGSDALERTAPSPLRLRGKLTWRLQSTFHVLTAPIPAPSSPTPSTPDKVEQS